MQIKEIIKSYSLLMQRISETKIAGVLPLDLLLHAFIGYLVYIVLKKATKGNSTLSLFLVFLLEITKEVIDSFSLTNTIAENVLDIIATMSIPIILFLIEKKAKSTRKLN